MRLSIREEVAYNRIVTELRETAMAEAIAEIELESMIEEMEEYLAWNLNGDRTQTKTQVKEEKVEMVDKGNEEKVEMVTSVLDKGNEDVHKMLDDLERELLSEKNKGNGKDEKKTEEEKIEDNKIEDVIELDIEKNVYSQLEDDYGTDEKVACTDQPVRSQKHRYLSIFTKRRKSNLKKEDNTSAPSETKTEKKAPLLKRLREFFCCCLKTEN